MRNEFAERLVGTEAESQSVKMEMSEMRARHRLEMERARTDVEAAQRSKDEEMAAVHDRSVGQGSVSGQITGLPPFWVRVCEYRFFVLK